MSEDQARRWVLLIVEIEKGIKNLAEKYHLSISLCRGEYCISCPELESTVVKLRESGIWAAIQEGQKATYATFEEILEKTHADRVRVLEERLEDLKVVGNEAVCF